MRPSFVFLHQALFFQLSQQFEPIGQRIVAHTDVLFGQFVHRCHFFIRQFKIKDVQVFFDAAFVGGFRNYGKAVLTKTKRTYKGE